MLGLSVRHSQLLRMKPSPRPPSTPSHVASFQLSQAPQYEANATAPVYLFHLSEDYKYWLLMRSDTIEYVSQRGWLENTPPSTGKKIVGGRPQTMDRVFVFRASFRIDDDVVSE